METWEAIITRRQVRQFSDRAVEDAHLLRVLAAASRSPSARNRQRWDFIVVEDAVRIERLSHVWQGASWTTAAPVVVALVVPVASTPDEYSSIRFDLGQVAMTMMLAATDAGLASGQANCQDQALARQVLGLPDDRECVMLIALGHPSRGRLSPIEHLDRRALGDVVHREVW